MSGAVPGPASPRNPARCRLLAERAVARLGLDLRGLSVVTEAASGHYALTPLIALLAGARQVLALARDTRFGSAAQAARGVAELAAAWGLGHGLTLLDSREDPRLARGDIVTNSGMLRPLDREFLERLKPGAAVPLMFEAWEHRPEDLDLAHCRRLGIAVAGTDEHHPDLGIFDFLGPLAVKLLLELEVELAQARLAVIGGEEFGEPVRSFLERLAGPVPRLRVGEGLAKELANLAGAAGGEGLDALVLAEHRHEGLIVGPGGLVTASELARLFPGAALAHISGGVDQAALTAAGVLFAPGRLAPPRRMSVSLDHLGPRPVVYLHAAGLRVGQDLARAAARGLRGEEAVAAAATLCPYLQPMPQPASQAAPAGPN